MDTHRNPPDSDLFIKLKWLMFSRLLFTSLLLGSTILLQLRESVSPLAPPLLLLYSMIAVIFLLSFGYLLIIRTVIQPIAFAYVQICVDTFVVTVIIFVTGSYQSVFSFLYLVVIIYSSILLYRQGSLIMAAICSFQYTLLIGGEYLGYIKPFIDQGEFGQGGFSLMHVAYKVGVNALASFAVAILSNLLAEQARKSKNQLSAMKEHIKRVEKMAAIGEMAAGLAHEIKNPLASLSGSIQLLQDDRPFDNEQDNLMRIVLREADRLSSLVNDFLLFARPQTGKVVPLDLERAIVETVQLFEKDASCRDRIELSVDLQKGVWVEMDPVHLRQVLWNILLNASESIEERGTITIQMESKKNELVSVRVSDTGCGIPKEMMASIFSPFVTTKPKGSGLGLSIVHRILESYGNMLELTSDVGQGTTFTLKLTKIDPPK